MSELLKLAEEDDQAAVGSAESDTEQLSQHTVVDMLEHTHAEQVFGTAEGRSAFLNDNTPEDLEAYMNRLNGLARGLPEAQHMMDGVGHVMMQGIRPEEGDEGAHAYEPPELDDRKPLLYEAFTAAKEITDPERAATMLGLVTNAVHPYMDGNGRTTRVTYSLLTRGYTSTEADKAYYEKLLINENRDIVDLDPTHKRLPELFAASAMKQLVAEHDYAGLQPSYVWDGYRGPIDVATGMMDIPNDEDRRAKDLMVNDSVAEPMRKILHGIVTDEGFETPILMRYMLENGVDPAGFVRESANGRIFIDLNDFVPTLDNEAIAKLFNIQSDVKRNYVRSLIHLFKASPKGGFADRLVAYYRPKNTARI